jgi:hypothetical protein
VGVRRHDFERYEKRARRAAARHAEPHGRRRVGGTRHMTVTCDGGAGAQAGVRHRDGRTPRRYRLRRTHAPGLVYSDSRPVKLVDSPPSTYQGARRCAGMRTAQADKMPNLDDLSLRMEPRLTCRALWAAPSGWNTSYDGCMRWGCWRAGWGAT